MMSYIRDIAVLSGLGLVLFGLYQLSMPMAYVAGGLLLTAGACLWSWCHGRNRNDP